MYMYIYIYIYVIIYHMYFSIYVIIYAQGLAGVRPNDTFLFSFFF